MSERALDVSERYNTNLHDVHAFEVGYTARATLITADATVLVFTWKQTFQQYREARKLGMASHVSTCLIRDGKPIIC